MMKKTFILLLISIVFTQISYSQFRSSFFYQNFNSTGEMINGYKEGKWLDVSDSGVVYAESYYHKDIPYSTWKINFPDGSIRKEIKFDSLGNVIKWLRYTALDNKKIIEIIPDSTIDTILYVSISYSEDFYFEYESKLYFSEDIFNKNIKVKTIIEDLLQSKIDKIIQDLKTFNFNGTFFLYNETGTIFNKIVIYNGEIKQNSKYYYRKGKIRDEEIYKEGRLYKTLTFDDTGNIIKEKYDTN